MRRYKANRKRYARRTIRRRKIRAKSKTIGGFAGNGIRTLTINKGLGFPLRFRTKLRYVEQLNMVSPAGVACNTYSFSCNGLYDPYITGTGHQPMYFDQFMAVYDHYRVIGSKCTATFWKTANDTAVPPLVSIEIDDDTSYPSYLNQAIELGNVTALRPIGLYGQASKISLGKKWSLKKYFKDKYTSDETSGDASNNPVEQSYYVICVGSGDQATASQVTVMMVIDYIVDFYELKTVGQS